MCGTCGCDGSGAVVVRRRGRLHRQPTPTAGPDGEALPRHQVGSTRWTQNEPSEWVVSFAPDHRVIALNQALLAKNDALASENRRGFTEKGILALNLVSGPGAGKTTLLVETLQRLKGQVPAAVIEGDQQTSFDADRIRETGVPALQINTGKGCHLDAAMVAQACAELKVEDRSVLFIENVGNLVCPAGFDLGEAAKVVILSVTEGEDKPLKYPDMFAAAKLMLLSKVDLLPHLRFDVERCLAFTRQVNPGLEILRVSTTTGEGMDAWVAWLDQSRTDLPARAGLL